MFISYHIIYKLITMKVPKNTGLSTKAIEYIERFSSGCHAKTALKTIVQYREECKMEYNKIEKTKNRRNMNDMLSRIQTLGEARDYITEYINKPKASKNPTHDRLYKSCVVNTYHDDISTRESDGFSRPQNNKANNTKISDDSIKYFVKCPTKIPYECLKEEGFRCSQTEWTHEFDIINISTQSFEYSKSYYTRTPGEFCSTGFNVGMTTTYDGEHETKYILRFQQLAKRGGDFYLYSSEKCLEALYEYKDFIETHRDDADNDGDEAAYNFYSERYDALESVAEYFENLSHDILSSAQQAARDNIEYMNSNHGCNIDIPECAIEFDCESDEWC